MEPDPESGLLAELESKLAEIAKKLLEAAGKVRELDGKTCEVIRDRKSVYLAMIGDSKDGKDGTDKGVCRVSYWSSYGDKYTWELHWPNAPMNALIHAWDGEVDHLERTIRKGLEEIKHAGLPGRRRRAPGRMDDSISI